MEWRLSTSKLCQSRRKYIGTSIIWSQAYVFYLFYSSWPVSRKKNIVNLLNGFQFCSAALARSKIETYQKNVFIKKNCWLCSLVNIACFVKRKKKQFCSHSFTFRNIVNLNLMFLWFSTSISDRQYYKFYNFKSCESGLCQETSHFSPSWEIMVNLHQQKTIKQSRLGSA